jgi:hypothetical protein
MLISHDNLDRLERRAALREMASRQARVDAQEAEQEAALAALQASLRKQFFQANPEAREAEYQGVAQRLLDDALRQHADADREAGVSGSRGTPEGAAR